MRWHISSWFFTKLDDFLPYFSYRVSHNAMIQTNSIFFSKHQNKAKFKNLDDSRVLSSNFPGLRISAASMTSTASTASVASMTSTASFHKNKYSVLCFYQPWYQNDLSWSLNMEWIIKNPLFYTFLAFFSWRLLRPVRLQRPLRSIWSFGCQGWSNHQDQ